MGLFDKKSRFESLDQLRTEWDDCRKCPLRSESGKVCHGIGNQNCQVMVVGQSPTKNESETGKMMQDRGGVEIREWFYSLASAWGISPNQIYFTNAVKCPAVVKKDFNKPAYFVDENGELSDPTVPAKQCGSYLEDEITLIKPRLIVTLGANVLVRFANQDPNKKIPRQLDQARKRLWAYRGFRLAAITMPIKLGDINLEIDEDREFLAQIFTMSSPVYKAKEAERLESWDSVFSKVDACKRCELHKDANCRVFGTGNTKAEIMFIGEAPGADEDKHGVPFIGQSGQLLRAEMKEAGINDQEVYITNTVKCRPKDNRDPAPEEMQACSSFLQSQIKLIKPKVIVAVGRHAIRAVTGSKDKITKIRGTHLSTPFLQSAIVIPIYHPSYVMRNLHTQTQAVLNEFRRDLKYIKELAYGAN